MRNITRLAVLFGLLFTMSLSGLSVSAVAAQGENVNVSNQEECDPTQDANCVDDDLFIENELRLDWGLAPGRGGCPSLTSVENAVDLQMLETGVAQTNVEHLSGCLFVAESYADPFAFTCPENFYCTADRGAVNVSIVGDGTRFTGAERVSFYGNVAYKNHCTYLDHELAYAELHDLTIVAFGDAFNDCEGVNIDPDSGVVDLGDVTNGAVSDGSSDDGDNGANACPSSAAEAADLLGGNASNWSSLDSDSWKYKGDVVTLTYPGTGGFDAWIDGGVQEGVTVDITVDEATYNCAA